MTQEEYVLEELAAEGNLRTLRDTVQDGKYILYDGARYVNMSSNDYLGLRADAGLQKEFLESVFSENRFLMSNSASRLMTGNSPEYEELESAVGAMYGGRQCLVFGSGYAANSGILPALVSKNDLIIADKLVHASLIDGMRLCGCEWQRYSHNDTGHLENLIRKALLKNHNNIWVATESVFSMDGDRAPLNELTELKRRYGIKLYVDEAHAFGVEGPAGAGYAAELGLDKELDIIVGTFGKAAASYGAFAVMSPVVRELLVNRMRPVIFSTALPPLNLMWTRFVIGRMPEFGAKRAKLKRLISKFPDNRSSSHIIPLMAHDNLKALDMAERLKEHGFWTTAVRYPTVPKGMERVRISLSAAMDEPDIDNFIKACGDIG